MKFRVVGSELGKLVQVLDKMVEDVVFEVKEDNLEVNVMNIERTMFAKFVIPVTDAEEGKVGLRVKDLKLVAKMFKKGDVMFQELGEGNVLVTDGRKKIKIPEIDSGDDGLPELPEFDTDTVLKVPEKEFVQVIRDVKQLADAVKFEGKVAKAVSMNHEYEYEFEEGEGESSIVVGIGLIELPTKLKAKEYVLRWGGDTPLIVEANGEFLEGVFVIAPRVED